MDADDERPATAPRPAEHGRERVLIACARCRRQYDVSGLARGERVRCECAEVLTVQAPRAHAPRPLRCGHCGGALAEAARKCAYCAAEITLAERRLSGVCPECLARLSIDARFCMECGIAIAPQALRAVREDASCPRCAGGLRARSVGSLELVECASCAGLWLDPEVFAGVCERADQQELARRHLAGEAPVAPVAPIAPGRGRAYLACLSCGDFMVPRNFGGSSGVIIDVCKRHGVWLDHDELARVLDFVRAGGLMRERERDLARLQSRAARARDLALAPAPALDIGLDIDFHLEDERARRGSDLVAALRWVGERLGAWLDG